MARGRRRSARTNKDILDDKSRHSSRSPSPEAGAAPADGEDSKCPACTGETTMVNIDKEKWVMCDACKTWYHWSCAGNGEELELIDKWFCKPCLVLDPKRAITVRAPARKSDRKRPPRDYANLNAGVIESDPNRWIKMMHGKAIASDPFKRMDGSDVCIEWLENDESAMREPIVIQSPDFVVMPKDLTVNDLPDLLGPELPVEVIDVAKQSTAPGWTLGRWVEYFNTEPEKREKIYNVISLEVTGTPLGDKILPPRIVRDLDWVEKFWPSTKKGKISPFPKVQLYCLMGVASAWTDWHIDFAGSSVYYHILKGSKVFYFIRPTPSNLAAYERWSGTEIQNHSWLGDMCDEVIKVELTAGNTMIIPSGWIHAVHTPEDTLVFGGNFLHSYDVATQLRVRNIEIATHVPKRFRFPLFSRLAWYVGEGYLADLKSGKPFSSRVLASLSALSDFLISEVRLTERGVDSAKKEAKEQIPSEKVKDAQALARELRWRVNQALGNFSDDEEVQPKSKLVNGHSSARKRKRVERSMPDDHLQRFKNFRPRTWDSVREETFADDDRVVKYLKPGELEDLAVRWRQWDVEEDGSAEDATVTTRRNVVVRLRHTDEGLERERIERTVEEWAWS